MNTQKVANWETLDRWLEAHQWFFVDHGIYTQEEWSDPDPYWGVELTMDMNTGQFSVALGQFVGLENKLDENPVKFQSMKEFEEVMENFRLAIGYIN